MLYLNFCLTWNLKFRNFLLFSIVYLHSHIYEGCFCTKFHLHFWHDSCFAKELGINTRSFNGTQFMTCTDLIWGGTTVAQWLRCCATNQKVTGSIPAGVSGFFIDIKSFRSHNDLGVDSASNRNEYEEYFLGVKAAGA